MSVVLCCRLLLACAELAQYICPLTSGKNRQVSVAKSRGEIRSCFPSRLLLPFQQGRGSGCGSAPELLLSCSGLVIWWLTWPRAKARDQHKQEGSGRPAGSADSAQQTATSRREALPESDPERLGSTHPHNRSFMLESQH